MIDPRQLTVLITGATAGFGAACARRFAAAGSRVIGTGRRAERLAALGEELGPRFHPLSFDVSDRAACTAAIESLPAEFQAIDVLVNNAGLARGMGPAHEADPEDWDAMIDVNIKGLLSMTRLVLPGMIERARGHIVNLGSVAGIWPYAGSHVYGGTKAFVRQFSRNLRVDLLGKGVRVTDIQPGLCKTEFSLVRFGGDASAADAPYRDIGYLSADDIAETVWWVATLPRHVNINAMEVMPTQQAWAGFAFDRSGSQESD